MEKKITLPMSPLISIVVPVYKVAKYLSTFIDCVISQTCMDFECILVDDGSPDDCGDICDRYAKCHKNIKVIHKSNGGVSSARNEGIKHARGEWLLFFDPDDLFHESTIEILNEKIAEFPSSQWIIFNYQFITLSGNIIAENHHVPTDLLLNNKAIKRHIFPEVLKKDNFLRSPWTKVYRRDIIVNNGLYFSARTFAEDYEFNLNYLDHINYVLAIENTLYSYCAHPSSAISRYHSQAIDIWKEDTDKEIKMISEIEESILDSLKTSYIQHKVSSLAYFLSAEQKHNNKFHIKLREILDCSIIYKLSGLSNKPIGSLLESLRQSLINGNLHIASMLIRIFRLKIFLQNSASKIKI